MSEKRQSSKAGYSLVEMLTVIAIIGVMSLVSVPMFMTYMRSAKMKSSLRQIASDIRTSRQRAITQNHPTMISFKAGQREYIDYDGTVSGGTTTFVEAERNPRKQLADIVYFPSSTDPCIFADDVTNPVSTSGWNDIIFLSNGTVKNVPGPPAVTTCTTGAGRMIIKTDYSIPKPLYTIDIYPTGQLKAN